MVRRLVLSSLIAITLAASLQAEKKTSIVITSASVSGSVLTIRGAGFGSATGSVSLGDRSLAVNTWAGTVIDVQLPANLAAGSYLVAVSRQSHTGDGNTGNGKDTASFIVTIGTVGPAGPPGAQGPPGPAPTSINFLAGVPCNVGSMAGFVSVRTGTDGTITLHCDVPPMPPPPPLCLDVLQPSDALVNEALTLFTHSQDVEIASVCGSSTTIACPGGVPITAHFHMNTTAVTLSPVTSAGTYPFTVTFSATAQNIPFSLTVGSEINCSASFDTTLTGSPTITLGGQLIFESHTVTGAGPINKVRAGSIAGLSDGLDDGDISVNGGFGCAITGAFTALVRNAVFQAVSDSMNRGACRECGTTTLGDCGTVHQ